MEKSIDTNRLPYKKYQGPNLLTPQIKGFDNDWLSNFYQELSDNIKTAKTHLMVLYAIYKAGNEFIHPKTAYCLKQKAFIKTEPDGSYSLDSAGERFIKRVLYKRGEEYIEPQKELMVTITESSYRKICEQNKSHRQAMRTAHDYAMCGAEGMVIKTLVEELEKW